jgi:hypothetical protein
VTDEVQKALAMRYRAEAWKERMSALANFGLLVLYVAAAAFVLHGIQLLRGLW